MGQTLRNLPCSRRLNDGKDDAHGPRGAKLAEEFRGKYFDFPDADFEILLTACRHHTISYTHEDITVQTRFDADRLDLARIGKIPDPKYLCTEMARNPEVISWACERSITGYIPDIISIWDK